MAEASDKVTAALLKRKAADPYSVGSPVAGMPAWEDMEGKLLSDLGNAFKSLWQDATARFRKPAK